MGSKKAHVCVEATGRHSLGAALALHDAGHIVSIVNPAQIHRGGSVEPRHRPGGPIMGGERLHTRNPTSKLMLTILAGLATWEREIMLERQREGMAKAKADDRYKGRPISNDAAQIRQLRAELSRHDGEEARYRAQQRLSRVGRSVA
jgi:transposase